MSDVAASCVHHWIIESSERGEGLGVCKHCGASRPFATAYVWDGRNIADVSSYSGRTGTRRRDNSG